MKKEEMKVWVIASREIEQAYHGVFFYREDAYKEQSRFRNEMGLKTAVRPATLIINPKSMKESICKACGNILTYIIAWDANRCDNPRCSKKGKPQ